MGALPHDVIQLTNMVGLKRNYKKLLLLMAILMGAILLMSVLYRPSTTEIENKKTNEDMLKEIKALIDKYNNEALEGINTRLRFLEEDAKQYSKITSQPINPVLKKHYPMVKVLNESERKRILVTGGAGFVGSHLVDKLMKEGHEVLVVDNYFTGRKKNVEHWIGHPNFELIHHDVVEPLLIEVDQIYHLASPASPIKYMYNPVKTIKSNTIGTLNMLGLAKRVKARILFASTSEIYGDPEVHPQSETYWGHVNIIGPRACYDESKRIAETMMYSYAKLDKVEVRVARIFNTYGPRMHMYDGRVVSNFIVQSLNGLPLTVYSPGNQTRSFMYVSDLVNGLIKLMNSNYSLPVNLGNPEEYTILEFAHFIQDIIGVKYRITMRPRQQDDPHKRRPDITRARKYLNWEPQVSLKDGLKLTVNYFQKELGLSNANINTRLKD